MDTGQLARLLGATAYCGGGQRIGPVAAVYVDEEHRPAWVSILVDPFAGERFAPLVRSWLYPDRRLVVAVIRRAVEEAPVAPAGHLGTAEEDLLLRYYAHVISPASSRVLPASVVGARLPRATDPAAVRLHRVTAPVPADADDGAGPTG